MGVCGMGVGVSECVEGRVSECVCVLGIWGGWCVCVCVW